VFQPKTLAFRVGIGTQSSGIGSKVCDPSTRLTLNGSLHHLEKFDLCSVFDLAANLDYMVNHGRSLLHAACKTGRPSLG
jgi:hypothetical protein